MITAPAFAGKKYAVLGLARSGAATVHALLRSGAKVMAWDDNEASRTSMLLQIKEDRQQRETPGPSFELKNWLLAKDLTGFDAIIVSPGVPLNRHRVREKAKRYGLPIIGDIELFARARPELPPHKVVGITGTNGKSTTTALVHHILKTAGVPTEMGGNIGLPILAQDPLPEGGVYVLELSSYQIDLTQSLDCDVAVLLNITPDHLDRYESFEAYAASKARLFEMQHTGIAVVPGDDEPSRKIINHLHLRPAEPASLPWPTNRAGDETLILWRPEADRVLRPMTSPIHGQQDWLALQGPHNSQNAAAAIGTCRLLGLSWQQIAQGLRTFPGLPHRMERVREKDGVTFVNDSKATNPTATAPALAAFERIRWILGGQAKTDNLEECAPYFDHVRSAYTIGEAADLFERLLKPHMPVKNCGKLADAVRQAAADAEPGDTVLLSPACASFDQFRDFEDRGEQFRELVGAL